MKPNENREGEVFVPQGLTAWWNEEDTRPRCSIDMKVAFSSQEAAERSASKIRARKPKPGDELMEAYKGKCGIWHVGHGKKPKQSP